MPGVSEEQWARWPEHSAWGKEGLLVGRGRGKGQRGAIWGAGCAGLGGYCVMNALGEMGSQAAQLLNALIRAVLWLIPKPGVAGDYKIHGTLVLFFKKLTIMLGRKTTQETVEDRLQANVTWVQLSSRRGRQNRLLEGSGIYDTSLKNEEDLEVWSRED